ncbi:MAG: hypoxanthine phosphoribosyltransferase [Thermoanaerobaculales bacterium]|nr:hypoxanthine phosphoribosyltransferase [Thermoanaerobaculales bacterium]
MLGRTVIEKTEIDEMVGRIAKEIEKDFGPGSPVFVGVLKGCVFFLTDLVRQISSPLEIDFIQVSSYGSGTSSSGTVVLVKDITADVRGRDVYLVEDIVDTGITLSDVVEMIRARHPRSVRIVSLLSKPSRRKIDVDIAYLGAEIDDVFVVGYGLDHAEQYRNLSDIRELIPESE